MADVTLRLAAAGGQATKKEVDAVRESARRLGYDIEATAAQSTGALGRVGSGFERLARQGQNLATISPALGGVVGKVETLGSRLSDTASVAGFLGGSLSDKVSLGATAATAGLLTMGAVGAKSFLSLTEQVRLFQYASGASAEDASKLLFTAHEFGVEAESVGRGVFKLSQTLKTNNAALAAYGLHVARNRDGSVNLIGTLENLSDTYNHLGSTQERNNLLAAAFGQRFGLQLAPLLARGREEIGKAADEAGRLGLVLSQTQVDQGKKLAETLHEVEAGGKGLAIGLGQGAVPAIDALTHTLVPAMEFLNRFHVLGIALEGLLAGKLAQGIVAVAAGMVRSTEAAIGQAAAIRSLVTAEDAETRSAARAALAERGRAGAATGGTAAAGGAAATGEAEAGVAAGGLGETIAAAAGPIGLAVAGIGLLSGVVQAFAGHAHDAAVSGQEFASAIQEDGNVAGDATKQLVAHALAQHGLRGEMQQTGTTATAVGRAVLGSVQDWQSLHGQLRDIRDAHTDVNGNMDATGMAASRLITQISNLRSGYQDQLTTGKAATAVNNELGGSIDKVATAANYGASEIDHYNASLSRFDALRDTAANTRSYAAEVDKLNAMLNPLVSGEAEHAARVGALGRAQQDATRATRARQDAERQLHDVQSQNVELLQREADLQARQADISARTAAREATTTADHVARLRAAGRGTQEIATAQDAADTAAVRSAQAADDARKAHETAGNVAAQHQRDLADATDRVTQAKAAEKDAQDKVTKAYVEAQVPASKLGATTQDIADQLDRVVQAAEKDWAAKLAAGMVTSDQAAAGLFTSLMNLRNLVTDPVLQAALDSVINATPFERKAERGALPGQAYRHAAGGTALGGWALVGEQGPELVRLSRGDRVYSNPDTRRMMATVPAFAAGGLYGDPGASFIGGGVRVVETVKIITIPQQLIGANYERVDASINGDSSEWERWARRKGVIPRVKANA